MPIPPERRENELPEEERDEAGIHKEREAVPEEVAQTPTLGEPQSEADRKREDAPPPASEPTNP